MLPYRGTKSATGASADGGRQLFRPERPRADVHCRSASDLTPGRSRERSLRGTDCCKDPTAARTGCCLRPDREHRPRRRPAQCDHRAIGHTPQRRKTPPVQSTGGVESTPDGIRTHVTALRGRRPRPLDDGSAFFVVVMTSLQHHSRARHGGGLWDSLRLAGLLRAHSRDALHRRPEADARGRRSTVNRTATNSCHQRCPRGSSPPARFPPPQGNVDCPRWTSAPG